jgi:hypothetical protein
MEVEGDEASSGNLFLMESAIGFPEMLFRRSRSENLWLGRIEVLD